MHAELPYHLQVTAIPHTVPSNPLYTTTKQIVWKLVFTTKQSCMKTELALNCSQPKLVVIFILTMEPNEFQWQQGKKEIAV